MIQDIGKEALERAVRTFGDAAAVARALGISPTTVRGWRARGVPSDRLEALAALRPPVEPVPLRHEIKGVSSLVRADGSIALQWVKTRRPQEFQEEILERLLRDLPEKVPARSTAIKPPTKTTDDLMAVYPLGDPHIGMLAWAPETGADFDLRIAEDVMTGAMHDLVGRGERASKALICNLGDFFHADNAAGHTTKGDHSLDLDGRAPRVLEVGFRIMVSLIDAALAHHREVTVDNRIGNHDGHTALMLAIGLRAHYRHEPRVTIPATVSHRSYYEFGSNLIGVTHGDRARLEALEQIMAAEQAAAWGRTVFRKWLVGHVHHSTVREGRGCTIETFRTLAARDSWHAAQGYQSGRDAHRILLHRTAGEVSREIVNVRALLAQVA